MTTMRRLTLGLLASTLLLVSAPGAAVAQDAAVAADMTGLWAITIESPEGTFEMTLNLEQHEDATLSGTMTADMIGDAAIESGWVEDGSFGFSVVIDAQGEVFEILYEGSVTGDEVVGSVDVGGGMFQADFYGERTEGGA